MYTSGYLQTVGSQKLFPFSEDRVRALLEEIFGPPPRSTYLRNSSDLELDLKDLSDEGPIRLIDSGDGSVDTPRLEIDLPGFTEDEVVLRYDETDRTILAKGQNATRTDIHMCVLPEVYEPDAAPGPQSSNLLGTSSPFASADLKDGIITIHLTRVTDEEIDDESSGVRIPITSHD